MQLGLEKKNVINNIYILGNNFFQKSQISQYQYLYANYPTTLFPLSTWWKTHKFCHSKLHSYTKAPQPRFTIHESTFTSCFVSKLDSSEQDSISTVTTLICDSYDQPAKYQAWQLKSTQFQIPQEKVTATLRQQNKATVTKLVNKNPPIKIPKKKKNPMASSQIVAAVPGVMYGRTSEQLAFCFRLPSAHPPDLLQT